MLTRVTQSAIARQLQVQAGRLQSAIVKAQAVVGSQKKLQVPSDDPVGTAVLNQLRGETTRLTSHLGSVGLGVAVLGAEDGALDQADALLTRAREIASQHASGLVTPAQRQAAAEEVEELERALLSLGNTAVGGRHVFGGLARGTPPFAAFDDPGFDPTTAYTGPAQTFAVPTAPDQQVRLTTPGDQVFEASLVAVDDLRQALAAGTDPTATIDALNTAAEGIRQERASVGGRLARLNTRDIEIRDSLVGARTRQSAVEDADLTEVIVELTQLQNAFEVTLTAGQALLRTSILDFVRLG